jgi:hypothetical protein
MIASLRSLFRPFPVLAALTATSLIGTVLPSLAQDDDLAGRVAALEAAAEAAASGIDSGSNAFLMICAALVLFMTLPGLALFYGGLVRTKNVLSVLAQCLGIAGLVTLLWWAVGPRHRPG